MNSVQAPTRLHKSELDSFITNQILPRLRAGMTISLCGGLGAGKTTFAARLLSALGYQESVTSPTYGIEHLYELENDRTVCHLDLYRVPENSSGFDILSLLYEGEYFLTLVEWAERVPDLTHRIDLEIHFNIISEEEREVRLNFRD